MSKDTPLYIVRGSGYGIDGSIVKIVSETEVDGETYFAINPVSSRPIGHNSILIHNKYLQPIGDNRLKTYTYTITVSKKHNESGSIEQDLLVINDAFRNINVATIISKLDRELGPILRLE